jgi:hypothetical protein
MDTVKRRSANALAAIGDGGRFLTKVSSRMGPCAVRSSHFCRAKFIPQLPSIGEQSFSQIPAMTLDLF